MTECLSVSGGLGMELSGCSSTSALGQNSVAALEMFTTTTEPNSGEERRSPTTPPAPADSAMAEAAATSAAAAADENSGSNVTSCGGIDNNNAAPGIASAAVFSSKMQQRGQAELDSGNNVYGLLLVGDEDNVDCLNDENNGYRVKREPLQPKQQQQEDSQNFCSSTAKFPSDDKNADDECDDDNEIDGGCVDEDEDLRHELLDGSLEENDCGTREGVCGVCLEPYTQPPRVLNCLHVFCEACLGKEQRPLSSSPNRGQATNGVISCPKCHTETECMQGLKSLPLDYVLINRLDAEAISRRTVICTSCKSEDHAIARCQDCSTFLCSSCRKAHSSMLCFENHQVVSFEAFDQETAQIHRAVSCLRHPREVAQLYDPTCGTAMCNECLVSGHQGHGCKKVNEFDAIERADLINLINEARLKFHQFDETNENLTTSLSELQLTRDSVRSSIEETFITYKSILEKVKEAALEDLEKVHSSQEMRVMDDIQLCQESRVNLEHAVEFADKLSKYGDAAEFLALKVLVTSRVRKLIHSCPRSRDNSAELKFITDEAKFKAAVSGGLFGQVVSLDALDMSNPNISGGLLNTSLPPEISNTSAARLLPAELVDAVNSSPLRSSHFSQLDGHPLLTPAGHQMSSGSGGAGGGSVGGIVPPSVGHSVLDSIAPSENQYNDLRSALAHMNLARLAGVSNVVEADVEPDVLPLLVGNVGDVVSPGHMISVGAESSRMASAGVASSDEEAQLINNLSALAKLATPFPVGQSTMQRLRGPPLSPTGLPSGLVVENGTQPSGSSSASGTSAGGQRSPTAGVGAMSVMPSAAAAAAAASAAAAAGVLQGPISQGSVTRTNRATPMHIRIKFGQLGSGQTQFSSPHGFCLGPNEEIVVADTNNHRIQIFDKAGEFKHEFGVQGKEEGQLWYPRKVAVIKSTGTYVICDRGNERSRMQLFTKTGEFIKKIAIRYIDIVAGLALTSDGRIVAVDSVSPTVFVIAEGGDLLLWFDCSEQMREPSDIAVWGSEFYICDFKGHCVVVYSECGNFLRRIGGETLTNFPNGIDISDHGDILVGDSHGNRFHIVVFNRDGQAVSEFECPYCKVSRCCGLKITSEGYVVTLAKNNHHVLILNTLYIN